jgi:hypothetical protein
MYAPMANVQNNNQEIPFTLSTSVNGSFTFENPVHDFAQKYNTVCRAKKDGSNSLGNAPEVDLEIIIEFSRLK